MKKILTLISISSLLLTACVGSKKTPTIETYSFAPLATTPVASTTKAKTVRLMPASISPQFSNYSFIYRTSNTQYLLDPYRQFLSSPNAEITAYLQNALMPSLNATLIASDNLMTANYMLQENVTALYADYQNKSAPKAVIGIQFILYHCKNGETSQIAIITLNEETNIAPNDPSSLIEGYQRDLDKIAKKLSLFINKNMSK